VYFVARAPANADGIVGGDNLYVWNAGRATRVISAPTDTIHLGGALSATSGDNASITPDGRHILFFSRAPLTGYDNTDRVTGMPDEELFRYDADTTDFVCVSCGRDGEAPSGDARFSSNVPTTEVNIRFQSDDGAQAFFESPDALVPGDNNGRRDVYEWFAGGVTLISAGSGMFDSKLVGVSASGRDVFFTTPDRLAGAEQDNVKVYDARQGGGFPGLAPASTPCSGDDCQGAPANGPTPPYPGSVSFTGPGNVATPRQITFSVRKISGAQLRRLARDGKVTLTIEVSNSGTVSATATSRFRGLTSVIASSRRFAARAGRVSLPLTLAGAARKELASSGRLAVHFTVRYSQSAAQLSARVTLRQVKRGVEKSAGSGKTTGRNGPARAATGPRRPNTTRVQG
jgi:hypothetical protein